MKSKIITGVAAAAIAGAASFFVDAPPEDGSALVDYQRKCTLAHAFHDQYLPKASGGTMYFTDGESFRPSSLAAEYARRGIGIANSLHTQRLARDKNLILNGVYTPNPADYELAGQIWEAIGPVFGVETAWGGRFNDGNHFSCAWQGRK